MAGMTILLARRASRQDDKKEGRKRTMETCRCRALSDDGANPEERRERVAESGIVALLDSESDDAIGMGASRVDRKNGLCLCGMAVFVILPIVLKEIP
jgi:hypothetical protein